MTSYRSSYSTYGLKNDKKRGKIFKILVFILACLVIAAGILFVTNYNTITLMMGKGDIKFNTMPQVKKSLLDTGKFSTPTVTSSADEAQVLTSVSKDNGVALTLTKQKSGKEKIDVKVNLKKMDLSGIDKKALLRGSPSAVKAAKTLANDYVGTVIDPNDVTAIETYLVTNLLSQYRSNPNSLNIDHTFGNAHLILKGNRSTGKVEVSITK